MTGDPVVGEKGPLETAADLLVYVPVGLAVSARDLLPGLAERGRAEVASQVSLARMVGQMVVGQGKDEVGRAMGGARQQVGSLVDQLIRTVIGSSDDMEADEPAGPPASPSPPTSTPSPPVARVRPITAAPAPPVARVAARPIKATPTKAASTKATPAKTAAAKTAAAKTAAAKAVPAPVAPAVASLAVPDYDSLAASQVIARLAALAPAELEAVRRYEDATRGRRTILGRIAQLQG